MMQRRECADARESGGQRIADADARAAGRRCRVTTDVAQPPHRFSDGAEPGARGIGPALTVSRHANHDQPGVNFFQFFVRQIPPLHRSGSKILEQEIRLRDQLARDLLALPLAQVQRDGLLVARDHRPPQRHAVRLLLAPLPHRVASARWLDLDDFGAEVAHQLPTEWSREQRAHLDQPQAPQRPRIRDVFGRHVVVRTPAGVSRAGANSIE